MTDREWRFDLDDLDDDGDDSESEPIGVVVVGAWQEALAADGVDRVVLIGLMTFFTIVMPALFILMLLEMAGVL